MGRMNQSKKKIFRVRKTKKLLMIGLCNFWFSKNTSVNQRVQLDGMNMAEGSLTWAKNVQRNCHCHHEVRHVYRLDDL
jgi:hypothetical protein